MNTENAQVAQEESETTKNVQVTNVGQAIHVLIQAVDMGRKSGIYDWNDLSLISQSISLLAPPKEDAPKEDANGPDISNAVTEE